MDSNKTDLDTAYYPDAASNRTIAIVFGTVIIIGLIIFFVRGGTLMGVGTMTWWR
jgi:hypothetical protein